MEGWPGQAQSRRSGNTDQGGRWTGGRYVELITAPWAKEGKSTPSSLKGFCLFFLSFSNLRTEPQDDGRMIGLQKIMRPLVGLGQDDSS